MKSKKISDFRMRIGDLEVGPEDLADGTVTIEAREVRLGADAPDLTKMSADEIVDELAKLVREIDEKTEGAPKPSLLPLIEIDIVPGRSAWSLARRLGFLLGPDWRATRAVLEGVRASADARDVRAWLVWNKWQRSYDVVFDAVLPGMIERFEFTGSLDG